MKMSGNNTFDILEGSARQTFYKYGHILGRSYAAYVNDHKTFCLGNNIRIWQDPRRESHKP